MTRAHGNQVFQDSYGNVIAGASIYVYEPGTTTPIAQVLYDSNGGGGMLANPLTTDQYGTIDFYLNNPQSVNFRFVKSGYPLRTFAFIAIGLSQMGDTVHASAVGDIGSAGVSVLPSASDHVHGREPYGNPGSSFPGDISLQGIIGAVSRSDHQHSREAWGTSGQIVAATAYGSRSGGATNAVAKADHVHDLGNNVPWVSERLADFTVTNTIIQTTVMLATSSSQTLLSARRGMRGKILGEIDNDTGVRSIMFRLYDGGGLRMALSYSVSDPGHFGYTFEWWVYIGDGVSGGNPLSVWVGKWTIGAYGSDSAVGSGSGTPQTGDSTVIMQTQQGSPIVGGGFLPRLTATWSGASDRSVLTGFCLPIEVF